MIQKHLKQTVCRICLLLMLPLLAGCAQEGPALPEESTAAICTDTQETGGTTMKLWINETEIPVIWEENDTVNELARQANQADITVSMSMYSDNEQVGPLGRSYVRKDVPTTTHNGDIVLYSGNQIVVFYGSNSWSYTRLGKMDLDAGAVTNLLANGDVTLRLGK